MFAYLSILVFIFSLFISFSSSLPSLTQIGGRYQISSTEDLQFNPYLYPALNPLNYSTIFDYYLLVPPLRAAPPPAPQPQFIIQLGAASGLQVAFAYLKNGATLKINRGGGNYAEREFQSDGNPVDSYIDPIRQESPGAFGNNQQLSIPISDFSTKTDLYIQVIDPVANTRSTYLIHATLAPADNNVEVVVGLTFKIPCDQIYKIGTGDFKVALNTELKKALASFDSITTLTVLSADCDSDVPLSRFSLKTSGSADSAQSPYAAYTQIVKSVSQMSSTDGVFLPQATRIEVASVNVIPVPPPSASSADRTLAIVVGCCAAAAALIMAGIFFYFHKKKQAKQWDEDKENTAGTGTKGLETTA